MNWKIFLMPLLFASCQIEKGNNSNPANEFEDKETDNEVQFEFLNCGINDTIIREGDFEYQIVKINTGKYENGEYEISWGDKKYKRKYPEKFLCWKSPDGEICDFTPKVDLITNKEIILRVTTSTPSTGNCSPIEYKMIYLPINQEEKPFEIEFYLKTEKDYAIFSNSFDTISVMNLTTKKVQLFELKPKPYFEFKTIDSSMDSIRIEEKELRFRYLVGTHEEYGLTERMMKLKI